MTKSSYTSNLENLIISLLNGSITVLYFCDNFESEYNKYADFNENKVEDIKIFSDLFDIIVWYSPYENERKLINNYISEDEVIRAATNAANLLGL